MSQSVLVVEDDPAMQHAIVRNLLVRGYEAVGAGTVEAALAALQSRMPALAILDIDLPDGSGWEVLRAIREPASRNQAIDGTVVRAIVMSALRPNPRLVNELSCAGFLEKPFPMDALLRLVSEAIGPARAADVSETNA